MGKTYRRQTQWIDDNKQTCQKGKKHTHSNNHKTSGMRIVNHNIIDDDLLDDVLLKEFNEPKRTH